VIDVMTGLRPDRPSVRVETERLGTGWCVHNYGHGGNGVSLSWGCAREVVDLVSRAGNQATDSAAQLPAGGVAGPPKYDPVRGRTGALPAETWIHRLNHRIPGAGH
jgi:hypothetical protein